MRKIVMLLLCLIVMCNCLFSQTIIDYVKTDNFNAVKTYIGSVNIKDAEGATPLMWAAFYSNLKMVKLLISKGANPKIKGIIHSPDGMFTYGSCLVIAAGTNKVDIVKYLIKEQHIPIEDKEYNKDEDAENGWTALQWAAVQNQCDVIKYLVTEKANVNAESVVDGNKMPLHFAAMFDKLEAAKLLISLGANINATDNYGDTPLDCAIYNSASRLFIKLMYASGAKCKDSAEQTVLERFKITKTSEL